MKFEHCKPDKDLAGDSRARPQPEYRVSLTLAVVDPQALWSAAAARLHSFDGMTADDVLDIIGPREDPDVADCIATLAKPVSMPGCIMDDFWVDELLGCPPRADIAEVLVAYPRTAIEIVPSRPARRSTGHLATEARRQLAEEAQSQSI